MECFQMHPFSHGKSNENGIDRIGNIDGIFYPLVNVYIANWKITIVKFGKSTINGPFSIAILNYQRYHGKSNKNGIELGI